MQQIELAQTTKHGSWRFQCGRWVRAGRKQRSINGDIVRVDKVPTTQSWRSHGLPHRRSCASYHGFSRCQIGSTCIWPFQPSKPDDITVKHGPMVLNNCQPPHLYGSEAAANLNHGPLNYLSSHRRDWFPWRCMDLRHWLSVPNHRNKIWPVYSEALTQSDLRLDFTREDRLARRIRVTHCACSSPSIPFLVLEITRPACPNVQACVRPCVYRISPVPILIGRVHGRS